MKNKNFVVIVLLLKILVIQSCFLQDKSRRYADKYLKLIAEEDKSIESRVEEMYELINQSDKNYIDKIAAIYLTKDSATWSNHFNEEYYPNVVSQWFVECLKEKIEDELEFRNHILEDIMKFDATEFKNAKYFQTKEMDPTINSVLYEIPLVKNYVYKKAINVFIYEGKSTILLVPRIGEFDKSIKKIRKAVGDLVETANSSPKEIVLEELNLIEK